METGRKFWVTVLCLLTALLAVGCVTWLVSRPTMPPAHVVEFYSGFVMACLGMCGFFNGGNVGATFAHNFSRASNRTVNETVTREIQERRALHDDATEDTP